MIDLAFDHHGRLHALEMGNGQGSGFPDPEAGRVVRVHPNGRKEVVLTGLTFPTGMTFGRDRPAVHLEQGLRDSVGGHRRDPGRRSRRSSDS